MNQAEILVDDEVVYLDGSRYGWPDHGAALTWSLRRSGGTAPPRVVPDPDRPADEDVSAIIFDLKIDLLSDPIISELTRGLEVEVAGYRRLSGDDHRLRAGATRFLRDRIIDLALVPPASDR